MARKPQRQKPRKVRRQKLRFIDPVLISVAEFARLSGLGYSLIRQLVADGELPSRVIGTRTWIIREAGVAWLRQQIEPRTPAA
jgi:excisionase family DNA binding protein